MYTTFYTLSQFSSKPHNIQLRAQLTNRLSLLTQDTMSRQSLHITKGRQKIPWVTHLPMHRVCNSLNKTTKCLPLARTGSGTHTPGHSPIQHLNIMLRRHYPRKALTVHHASQSRVTDLLYTPSPGSLDPCQVVRRLATSHQPTHHTTQCESPPDVSNLLAPGTCTQTHYELANNGAPLCQTNGKSLSFDTHLFNNQHLNGF